MKKIGIIGGGNMGVAIIVGIRKKFKILVCEKDKKRCNSLKKECRVSIKSLDELAKECNIIILAVKPQNIQEVLSSLKENLNKNKVVISIAAGITTAFIEKALGSKTRVVRVMPNMPALIGEGITALSKGKYAKKGDLKLADDIFFNIGDTVIVKEELMDSITAVSGSGPAYVFLFVECMIKAAMASGLDKTLSEGLVINTLLGSGNLLSILESDPALLRAKVTSKGGTTQAAMDVFKNKGLEKTFKLAVLAAKKRAKQLSRR